MATENLSTDPLRPKTLTDFQGQPKIVNELNILINAANSRNEPAPHTLLSGPPGLGKTTLAGIIAEETNLDIITVTAPSLDSTAALTNLLLPLKKPTVIFIDEIHQLPRAVEETLYSAMEDQRLDIIIAEGTPQQRIASLKLEPFTLIGATTRTGSLGAPFRDRFGYIARLKPYDNETLTKIVIRNSKLLNTKLTKNAAETIAERSRGTPRIANRNLRRVRDYIHAQKITGKTKTETTKKALDTFGTDHAGLSDIDRDLLEALCVNYNGGPVGLGTLAAIVGETPLTIEEVHEPYLMQIGMLARTPRGRVATNKAYEHLKIELPEHLQ